MFEVCFNTVLQVHGETCVVFYLNTKSLTKLCFALFFPLLLNCLKVSFHDLLIYIFSSGHVWI